METIKNKAWKDIVVTSTHIILSYSDCYNKTQVYTINRYMQSENKCKF